jgi:hypothetical protein
MAIPKELEYDSEAIFITKFVVPLLQRLGFSLVVNYHGTKEFGKDIVFGEIDRFGHVVYHGLQAKNVASISQSDSEGLINDAKESFRHPFTHPNKGNVERISTFTVVNAGSISDNAKQNFFVALEVFGRNVQMLDGPALLVLDKSAAFTQRQIVGERLTGMLLEIRENRSTIDVLSKGLEMYVLDISGFPMPRMRAVAISAYLETPFSTIQLPFAALQEYWQYTNSLNAIVDSMGSPAISEAFSVEFKRKRYMGYRSSLEKYLALSNIIEQHIRELLGSLSPLTQL